MKLAVTIAALLAIMAAVPASAQRPRPVEELARRATADSNDPMAHYELAMGYWERKKWDEAERSLRTATRLAPSLAEGWLALSILPVERGERYWKQFGDRRGQAALDSAWSEARRFRSRAFLTNPLVDLRVLGSFKARSRVETIVGQLHLWWASDFEKAVNALRQSRYDEAWQRTEKILTDRRAGNDRSTSPWFILWHHGQAAARTGRLEEAIQDFSMLTGRARAQESREPPANDRITEFLELLSGSPYSDRGLESQTNEFRFMLGMLYFMAGQLDRAVAVFQRTLEFDVGLYQAHVQLARIYEARQDWTSALEARRKAVATNPDDHTLLVDLATLLARLGHLDEAMDHLDEAAALGPRDPRVPWTLGMLAAKRQDHALAATAFTRYLALAPSSEEGQIAEARRQLALLASSSPQHQD